jgi:hypothetical protein
VSFYRIQGAPEQKRRNAALIYELTEEPSFADQVFLADKIGKNRGAHPFCQGGRLVGLYVHDAYYVQEAVVRQAIRVIVLILCLALSLPGW